MDIENLLGPIVFLWALAICALVKLVRGLVESVWLGSLSNRVYQHLVLSCLPVLIGFVMGLFQTVPVGPFAGASPSAHILFGLVSGLLSGQLFKVVVKSVEKLSGVEVEPAPATLRSPQPAPPVLPPNPPVPPQPR